MNDQTRSVCQPALLHCMHNPELFSKLAFEIGKYTDLDMAELDLTKVRDYATYLALTANSQGKGGERALARLKESLGEKSWAQHCSRTKEPVVAEPFEDVVPTDTHGKYPYFSLNKLGGHLAFIPTDIITKTKDEPEPPEKTVEPSQSNRS